MKKYIISSAIIGLLAISISAAAQTSSAKGLKDAIGGKFLIGTAMNTSQIMEKDTPAVQLIRKHFNGIVAENCMKSMYLQPREGEFYFDEADRLVAFGEKYGITVTGHTLIWHSQAPRWFFTDGGGKTVSREVLIERMRKHIHTVVGRYKGRVKGWDVVNEAVLDDGRLRESPFLRIIGPDYLRLAFEFAREADPEAELYYNDYSMAIPEKRQGVLKMVQSLLDQGARIDAIGMQGHLNMTFPSVDEFEASLLAFASLGVKVMITELDLSALPEPQPQGGSDIGRRVAADKTLNPYVDGLTAEAEKAWSTQLLAFFDLFRKHADKITRVTFWGVSDATSWKNNFPVFGRTDYPLIFDRAHKEKPVVDMIIKLYE
ncbi:MAG: endo-1,4-beta-xylanase [Tannerellaceae bacterium]|jgi:endo-1,4-beta-xylanase|nr:endo-1,4-beta-xylanase [Tannerellaceae bacterium]